MKAVFEKLQTEHTNSILIRKFDLKNFDAPFHFHPEFELTLILKGEGQRYVGRQVNNFYAGDLVFLGDNLPHCWVNQPNEEAYVSAIVIQFDENFLGKTFLELPEIEQIKKFLLKAKSGFTILGETKKKISKSIIQLIEKTPLQRILGLIEILDELSQTKEISSIDFSFIENQYNQSETARFQKVFSYLIENFKENISLEEIADVADLSPTSFCRYFKTITQKTFVEVMLEFRLQYACQLLQKTDLPIRQIAFESGFGDVSYFNKVFKKYKSTTPKNFKSQ